MDNQNDPNSSNNDNFPPGGITPLPTTPPSPFPDLSSLPQSGPITPEPTLPAAEPTAIPQPDPATSGSTPSWPPPPTQPTLPADNPPPAAYPTWSSDPMAQSTSPSSWPSAPSQANPTPQPAQPDTWPTLPPQTDPAAPTDTGTSFLPTTPTADAIVPQNPSTTLTPPFTDSTPQPDPVTNQPILTEPAPTFTPPVPAELPVTQPASSSPLDNPWGAQSQTPPADQNTPTTTTQPSWSGIPANPAETQNNTSPIAPTEAAPTDLSHLINNNQPESTNSPAPETIVAPFTANTSPQEPNLPTEAQQGGIPKWLIGVGVGLLLLVIGASAYFILGIGQPAKTTSLPAETTPKTTEVKTPPPIVTPTTAPVGQPDASGSANFGQLGSGGAQPQQATNSSAIETLRQEALLRQQQGI